MTEPGRCDAGDVDALIGRRVVVRHRIGELLSDAVGELAADGADLVVHTRRGPVRVRRGAVTAVRPVPPPVPRRASLTAIARLEELCADAWPALTDQRLGAWRLRAAEEFTGRANAALAIGDPGVPIATALVEARAFAARHGITPRVQAPTGSPWDRAVAAHGWVLDVGHRAGAEVSVQVADLGELGRAEGPGDVEISHRPDDAWWRQVLGRPPSPPERHVLASPSAAGFLVSRDATGTAVGAGRAVVVDDHVHLSALVVDPAVRRRGLGGALVAAAAAWGRERGARWGVLQVATHNTAALALYAAAGWTEHHRYRYLVMPSR